jgi:hypothetical protein
MKRIIIIFLSVAGLMLQSYCLDTTSFFYNKKWVSTKKSRAEYVINEIKLAEKKFILEITYTDGFFNLQRRI